MFPMLWFLLRLLAIQAAAAKAQTNFSRPAANWLPRDQQILAALMANYDCRVRPPAALPGTNDTAVRVSVNILVRMLSNINVVDMEYSLQITFREQWLDRRLAYDKMALSGEAPAFLTVPHVKEKLWLPDTFFPTEKSAHRHTVDKENMFVRVYPNGTVLYSSRLSLVCSCPMHLQLYPLDIQHCDFDLISYAFTTRDIIYEWDKNKEPVQLKKGVGRDLPNFLLDEIDTGVECTSHTNTGTYACLRMRMRLSRLMTYFVLQLYLPTSMIVFVSLVSFWIDMHSTAGRVALAITTLLTITTMQSSINAKLPPVNYVKVVDVWLGACQAFVFCALIEYAVVCYQDTALRNAERRATELRLTQRRRNSAFRGPQARVRRLSSGLRALLFGGGWPRLRHTEEQDAPCMCEMSDFGCTLLSSLGIVPAASYGAPLVHSSLLFPLDDNNNNNGLSHFQMVQVHSQRSHHSLLAYLRRKLRKPDYVPARIDWYARIWMPVGFVLFNVAYWSICLGMAAQQKMQRQ